MEGEGSVRESLFECAEHVLLEMRDRFDLKRGDSRSLDALEDVLSDCACGHSWSEHDQYGCLVAGCCRRKGATVAA